VKSQSNGGVRCLRAIVSRLFLASCLIAAATIPVAAASANGGQSSSGERAQSRAAQTSPTSEASSLCAASASPQMEEPASEKATELTSIRTCTARDFTRVVINLGGPVKYQVSRLGNPDRIYFDLRHANLDRSVLGKPISVEGDIVKDVHIAQNQAGTVRVVLQTAGVSDYSVKLLRAPYRMVVDVFPQTAPAAGSAVPGNASGASPKTQSPGALPAQQVQAKDQPTPQTVSTPFGEMRAPPHTASALPAQSASTPGVQSQQQTQEAVAAASNPQSSQQAAPVVPATPKDTVPPTGMPAPGQAASVPTQRPETKSQPEGASGIALNLDNADLYQVLRIIGTELKINYIVDPGVKGTVNITTAGSVSRADLFTLLQTILQINGAMIVKGEGYYHIVPITEAKQAPLPLNYAKGGEPINPESGMSLEVIPMHFVSAAEMGRILTPFLSTAGQLVIQEQGNILLIAETTAKLKQFREIVDTFDSPVFSRERVRLFPITNNLAKNLVTELQSVFGGYGLSEKTSAIRFVALERLNAILAISPSPDVFEDVEKWINKLDQASQKVGIRNFVYNVQNAKASDLRDILIELYGGQVVRAGSQSSNQPTNPTAATATPQPAGTSGAADTTAGASARVQGEIRILSDDKNNALIVQASAHDYEIIESTLQQMDVLPRQVLIDAKIYEVDLSGALSMGISAYLATLSQLPGPLPLTTSVNEASGTVNFSTFSMLSATTAVQAFLTASENSSRVRTLSSPSILVTDNTNARIQVGSEVPVPTGSSLTPVQSNGSSIFAQTIQYLDTGVILTVTPRVNSSGIVTLNIAQEVSGAVPNTTSNIVAPVVNKTAFQTTVILKDGQTLALGGIIETSDSYTRSRIPIIGDIPGLGTIFGSTTKNTSRKELVLLITPHVVLDIQQGTAASDELLHQMREVRKMLDAEAKQKNK
jgi:general secretion pathway protein D